MLKKNEYNLMSTIKNYIFYFLKQKERENINNLMIYMGDVAEFKC